MSSSWCYVCVTVFLSSLQSHDVLWRSEIWKENVVSSNWGRSPQPSQVHTHPTFLQYRSTEQSGSNVVLLRFIFSLTFFLLFSKSLLLCYRHSHTNLQLNFLFSTATVPTTASVLTGNLRASRIVLWSFLSLSHSYEKRLYWGEASRSACSRRILSTDTLCKHTLLARPLVFLLYTCTNNFFNKLVSNKFSHTRLFQGSISLPARIICPCLVWLSVHACEEGN